MTWVHDRIFAAGGAHIPRHWDNFVHQYGPTAIVQLNQDGPTPFAGPPPPALLWLGVEREELASHAVRLTAAEFVGHAIQDGGQVLLHSPNGRHRTRWVYVAYLIWSGVSALTAIRRAGQAPWLSPYETDQDLWQDFQARVHRRAEPASNNSR